MKCPNCKEGQLIDMRHAGTPEGELPMQCNKCGTKFANATKIEPQREWRFNDAGDGNFRLVELADGELCAVGLNTKIESDQFPVQKEAEARAKFGDALRGMMDALDKPTIVIKQVIEEREDT